MVLGFETLNLRFCEIKLRELTVVRIRDTPPDRNPGSSLGQTAVLPIVSLLDSRVKGQSTEQNRKYELTIAAGGGGGALHVAALPQRA